MAWHFDLNECLPALHHLNLMPPVPSDVQLRGAEPGWGLPCYTQGGNNAPSVWSSHTLARASGCAKAEPAPKVQIMQGLKPSEAVYAWHRFIAHI